MKITNFLRVVALSVAVVFTTTTLANTTPFMQVDFINENTVVKVKRILDSNSGKDLAPIPNAEVQDSILKGNKNEIIPNMMNVDIKDFVKDGNDSSEVIVSEFKEINKDSEDGAKEILEYLEKDKSLEASKESSRKKGNKKSLKKLVILFLGGCMFLFNSLFVSEVGASNHSTLFDKNLVILKNKTSSYRDKMNAAANIARAGNVKVIPVLFSLAMAAGNEKDKNVYVSSLKLLAKKPGAEAYFKNLILDNLDNKNAVSVLADIAKENKEIIKEIGHIYFKDGNNKKIRPFLIAVGSAGVEAFVEIFRDDFNYEKRLNSIIALSGIYVKYRLDDVISVAINKPYSYGFLLVQILGTLNGRTNVNAFSNKYCKALLEIFDKGKDLKTSIAAADNLVLRFKNDVAFDKSILHDRLIAIALDGNKDKLKRIMSIIVLSILKYNDLQDVFEKIIADNSLNSGDKDILEAAYIAKEIVRNPHVSRDLADRISRFLDVMRKKLEMIDKKTGKVSLNKFVNTSLAHMLGSISDDAYRIAVLSLDDKDDNGNTKDKNAVKSSIGRVASIIMLVFLSLHLLSGVSLASMVNVPAGYSIVKDIALISIGVISVYYLIKNIKSVTRYVAIGLLSIFSCSYSIAMVNAYNSVGKDIEIVSNYATSISDRVKTAVYLISIKKYSAIPDIIKLTSEVNDSQTIDKLMKGLLKLAKDKESEKYILKAAQKATFSRNSVAMIISMRLLTENKSKDGIKYLFKGLSFDNKAVIETSREMLGRMGKVYPYRVINDFMYLIGTSKNKKMFIELGGEVVKNIGKKAVEPIVKMILMSMMKGNKLEAIILTYFLYQLPAEDAVTYIVNAIARKEIDIRIGMLITKCLGNKTIIPLKNLVLNKNENTIRVRFVASFILGFLGDAAFDELSDILMKISASDVSIIINVSVGLMSIDVEKSKKVFKEIIFKKHIDVNKRALVLVAYVMASEKNSIPVLLNIIHDPLESDKMKTVANRLLLRVKRGEFDSIRKKFKFKKFNISMPNENKMSVKNIYKHSEFFNASINNDMFDLNFDFELMTSTDNKNNAMNVASKVEEVEYNQYVFSEVFKSLNKVHNNNDKFVAAADGVSVNSNFTKVRKKKEYGFTELSNKKNILKENVLKLEKELGIKFPEVRISCNIDRLGTYVEKEEYGVVKNRVINIHPEAVNNKFVLRSVLIHEYVHFLLEGMVIKEEIGFGEAEIIAAFIEGRYLFVSSYKNDIKNGLELGTTFNKVVRFLMRNKDITAPLRYMLKELAVKNGSFSEKHIKAARSLFESVNYESSNSYVRLSDSVLVQKAKSIENEIFKDYEDIDDVLANIQNELLNSYAKAVTNEIISFDGKKEKVVIVDNPVSLKSDFIESIVASGVKLFAVKDNALYEITSGGSKKIAEVKSLEDAVKAVRSENTDISVISSDRKRLVEIDFGDVLLFSTSIAENALNKAESDADRAMLAFIVLPFAAFMDKRKLNEKYNGVNKPFVKLGRIYELNVEYVGSYGKNIKEAINKVVGKIREAVKKAVAERAIGIAA